MSINFFPGSKDLDQKVVPLLDHFEISASLDQSVGLAPSTTLLPEEISSSSSRSIAIFMKDMMEKEEGVVLASIFRGILGDRGLENRSRGLVKINIDHDATYLFIYIIYNRCE
jgi:hypothetical protein